MHLGGPELLIILVIVLLIFGVGRISRVGKELGTGIREFRKGLSDDQTESGKSEEQQK
ncbi:MAG TPA: twin-arginine translocase TatA/TatE family subunit [Anaerolineae bacterium]|nr:twin-arginine translocase TatA/TatE family subunit [Anaerolineae bacterium]